MPIRLRKSAGFVPTRLPVVPLPDPPVYLETLRDLVARDPSFMADLRVAPPVPDWSALDALMAEVAEEVAA